VKASINANCANFTNFDSVKDTYVEFKRTENPPNDPQTRQVASVARGGRGGGSVPRRPDQGQGAQIPDKRQMGLVPQSEVDKQTHIVNRHYSDAESTQLTPAEKQKIWQLRNPGMTPGTGPTRCDRRRAVALTSTSSASLGGPSKHPMEDPTIKSDQPADDQGWGRNCESPFLSCQVRPHGKDTWRVRPPNKTLDPTIKTADWTVRWTPDLTQTIETLRTFNLYIDQRLIVKDVRYKLDGIYEITLELDSHADTCVLGHGASIILDYKRPVTIVGYDESLRSKTYQTVSGVVA
jgi:hypothetical protein